MTDGPTELEIRMQFMFALRAVGVTDERVLKAMETTPRELFVEEAFAGHAYDDRPLPIACAQTISQPSVVAYMTQALAPTPRCKVLEIGAGSGYQTAILAKLARRVYAIERHKPLAKLAEQRLATLGLTNVVIRHGDGALGWEAQAPFDRILVAAAAADPPPVLLAQLKPGGVMVLPVGEPDNAQQLIKVEKTPDGPHYTELMDVRFVPLLEGAEG